MGGTMSDMDKERELLHEKVRLDRDTLAWETRWKRNDQIHLKQVEITNGYALAIIRSLLLFNGGGVLSLLTFYGNILVRSDIKVASAGLTEAFELFLYGVVAALVCGMVSYFSQFLQNVLLGEILKDDGGFNWATAFAYLVIFAAMGCAIASLVFFTMGVNSAVNLLSSIG